MEFDTTNPERAQRADQHVSASAWKNQKNQLYEPKNTKIQDSDRDSDFKPLALRARSF